MSSEAAKSTTCEGPLLLECLANCIDGQEQVLAAALFAHDLAALGVHVLASLGGRLRWPMVVA